MDIEHFNTELIDGYDDDGEAVTLVNMECRVCDEATAVPARYLGTGNLSRLIVRR